MGSDFKCPHCGAKLILKADQPPPEPGTMEALGSSATLTRWRERLATRVKEAKP